jgi:murein DD-endopeptidase MepM/ murein hydrolase activator NlpD
MLGFGNFDYQIVYGDTLSAIAQKYGTSVAEIAEMNNIVNPDIIYAGDYLTIPGDNPADQTAIISGATLATPVNASTIVNTPKATPVAPQVAFSLFGLNIVQLAGLCISAFALYDTYGKKQRKRRK